METVGYAVGWVEEITSDFSISAGIIQLLVYLCERQA